MTGSEHRDDLAAVPEISHLLETSLYVGDLARARGFYTRLFNLTVIFEDDRMCALKLPGSGVLLLFLEGGSLRPSQTPGGVIPPHGGTGRLHLCFAISRASLEAWERHLVAEEVALESRVVQYFGGISLYFRDPDGHSLEVATPGLWPHY